MAGAPRPQAGFGAALRFGGEAAAELRGSARRQPWVLWRGGSRAACGRRPGSAQRCGSVAKRQPSCAAAPGGSLGSCGEAAAELLAAAGRVRRSEANRRRALFFAKKLRINLVMSAIIRNFALENYGKRAANIHHIKVDWETRQFYVNYRDNLTRPMAGPIPCGTASEPGDYKGR